MLKIMLFGDSTDPVRRVITEESTLDGVCKLTNGHNVKPFLKRPDGSTKELRLGMGAKQLIEHSGDKLFLVGNGNQRWAVYTVDFYREEEKRIKDALDKIWAPMFPGESSNSDVDTELFKALIAKRLSPSEVSVDPVLDPDWPREMPDMSKPSKPSADLKRKQGKDSYEVPCPSYAEDPRLRDKEQWLATRLTKTDKAVMLHGLVGPKRSKKRKQINWNQSTAYSRLQDGEVLVNNKLLAVNLRISSTGWMGLSFPVIPGSLIIEDWHSGAIYEILRNFQKVPYKDEYAGGTFITDAGGRLLIFRSHLGTGPTLSLHNDFVEEAARFKSMCTPVSNADRDANRRGDHWFCIAGYDQQNKAEIKLSKWHEDNQEVINEFFAPGTPFTRITGLVNSLLMMHFPKIAMRYQQNINMIKEKTNRATEAQFGLFWNFCLNAAYQDIPRVHCWPHVDSKNIAVGVCALYIYGNFNSRELSWLCIWEAGIIIELPPGTVLLYPSALFYHFNVDIRSLDIRTTSDVSSPTPSSPKLAESGAGRGSCVWFNQATMFQAIMTKYKTLAEARKAEPSSNFNCDNEKLLEENYFPGVIDKSKD